MNTFTPHTTIGELVRERPARSRIFEKHGIDYCCGGKKPLAQACRERGIDPDALSAELVAASDDNTEGADPGTMGLSELADHIEATHHAYLREELPRLDFMTRKVADVHGDEEPQLREIREVFVACRAELDSHTQKEERVLFPMIRELERADGPTEFHCGSLANLIGVMEREHESAGHALDRFRELTDGYTPPQWACNTYRAMVDALAAFERDMHQHVHKENNVLFPRALDELDTERNNTGDA